MASQSAALQLILQAINAMREACYTQEDTQELASHAWEHLEGGATRAPTPSATAPSAAASSSAGQPTSRSSWSENPPELWQALVTAAMAATEATYTLGPRTFHSMREAHQLADPLATHVSKMDLVTAVTSQF